MQGIDGPTTSEPAFDDHRPWFRLLTRSHWFVLLVAALGWLFDCMDQQLFTMARVPAMRELIRDERLVPVYAGYVTSIFLVGWGTGGIIFGILADLIGRARTMVLTILLYSLFTGLSAFSVGFWDFALYRFLTGLGVGGEFAAGVALVAEVIPDRARPFALGLLQALSAVGTSAAAVIGIGLAHLAHQGTIASTWRLMFVVGAAPALLALVIRSRLSESQRWQTLAASTSFRERLRSYFGEIAGSRLLAKNALIGVILGSSGIIGVWGIGLFSIDLQRSVFRARGVLEGLRDKELSYYVDHWAGVMLLTFSIGAFGGIAFFSWITHYLGRRLAFAICYLLAMLSTAFVFWQFSSIGDIFWMTPMMGFCQLSLFGGFTIYFPELFPTRLRSTGTSLCYNVARFVAATGPAILGLLTSQVFKDYEEPLRYAGVTMCSVFLVGLLALPFAPETRGKPLPE